MRWSALLSLLSPCLCAAEVAATPPAAPLPDAFALVVGYNDTSDPDKRPLRFADDDAVQTAALLRELGMEVQLLTDLDDATAGLFPDAEVHAAPTRAALRTAVAQIDAQIERRGPDAQPASFYFFYSGHGDVRGGEGYITLADGPLGRRDFFREVLDPVRAPAKHVVIDACKSYFLVFARGEDSEREPYLQPFDGDDALRRRPGTGFLLSTSASESSHEWEAFGGGVFSHEVRSALRGGADLDRDGRVTYEEVAGFIFVANRSIKNEKYRPRFLAVPPLGDDLLVSLANARGRRLALDTGLPHRLYLEDGDGVRYADVRPGADPLTLLLPARRRLFVRDVDRDLEVLLDETSAASLSALSPRAPETAMRGSAHVAFTQLFGDPFDTAAMTSADLAPFVHRRSSEDAAVPRPTAPSSRWIALGAGTGLAVALAGLSGVLWLQGNEAFEAYRRAPASEQPALRDRAELFDASAVALGVAAGVTAVVGGVLFWVLPEDGER